MGEFLLWEEGGGATSYYADPRAYTMKIINTLSIVVEIVFVLQFKKEISKFELLEMGDQLVSVLKFELYWIWLN